MEGDIEIPSQIYFKVTASIRLFHTPYRKFLLVATIDGQILDVCLKQTHAQEGFLRSLFSLEVAGGRQLFEAFQGGGSNICWNSGRKYSNGGFVALARPTARVASVRG